MNFYRNKRSRTQGSETYILMDCGPHRTYSFFSLNSRSSAKFTTIKFHAVNLKTIWWVQSSQHYQIISNIRRKECYNEWGQRNLYSLSYDQNFDWYAPGIFHFLIGQWRRDANRLEICPDRCGQRSFKCFPSVQILLRKQCIPLLNLCRNVKSKTKKCTYFTFIIFTCNFQTFLFSLDKRTSV